MCWYKQDTGSIPGWVMCWLEIFSSGAEVFFADEWRRLTRTAEPTFDWRDIECFSWRQNIGIDRLQSKVECTCCPNHDDDDDVFPPILFCKASHIWQFTVLPSTKRQPTDATQTIGFRLSFSARTILKVNPRQKYVGVLCMFIPMERRTVHTVVIGSLIRNACHSVLRIGRDGRARGHWSREECHNKKLFSLYYGSFVDFSFHWRFKLAAPQFERRSTSGRRSASSFFCAFNVGFFFLRGRYWARFYDEFHFPQFFL
jgi:hypothetical protein